MSGFNIVKSLTNFDLSLGEIIILSNFPYLISILSNEGAGDDIWLFVLEISLIFSISIGLYENIPHLIFSFLLSIIYSVLKNK